MARVAGQLPPQWAERDSHGCPCTGPGRFGSPAEDTACRAAWAPPGQAFVGPTLSSGCLISAPRRAAPDTPRGQMSDGQLRSPGWITLPEKGWTTGAAAGEGARGGSSSRSRGAGTALTPARRAGGGPGPKPREGTTGGGRGGAADLPARRPGPVPQAGPGVPSPQGRPAATGQRRDGTGRDGRSRPPPPPPSAAPSRLAARGPIAAGPRATSPPRAAQMAGTFL